MGAPEGWKRAWVYVFIQSETFALGFLGLVLGIGVGFVTVRCAIDLLRSGDLELCAISVVTGTVFVTIAFGQLTRSIVEANRSYRATRRLFDSNGGPAGW